VSIQISSGAGSGQLCFNIPQEINMCSTHYINCHKCGTEIAFWSMFDNIQHEEEWECCGAILDYRYNSKLEKNKRIADGFTKDDITLYLASHGLTGKDWSYCHLINDTSFCKKCAKKLNYICSDCGSKIVKKRDENGYCVKKNYY